MFAPVLTSFHLQTLHLWFDPDGSLILPVNACEGTPQTIKSRSLPMLQSVPAISSGWSKLNHLIRRIFRCAVLIVVTLSAAQAAPAPIKVTAAQISKLGIQLAQPQAAVTGQLSGLSARVVVPPRQMHVLSAPLAGVVTETGVSPGDSVRRGQVVFQLASPAAAELRRSSAQALIQLQLAERNAKRDQQLLDEGLISESRHRLSQSTLAESRVVLAERRESMRLAGVQTHAGAQGTVPLRAPIDGIVLELMVSPSARVEASAPLVRIAQADPLWLEIQLPLRDAARAAVGAMIKVPGTDQMARVIGVAGDVSAETQTVNVRALVPNAERRLRPGQFLVIDLPVKDAGGAALWRLPTAAIVRIDEQAMVFVRDRNGFQLKPVQVRQSDSNFTIVSAEFDAETMIAVSGATSLKAIATGVGSAGGS